MNCPILKSAKLIDLYFYFCDSIVPDDKIYSSPHPFHLEVGSSLPEVQITYTDRGDIDAPVIWICHALTANSDPEQWWPGLVGPGKLFDSSKYRVICANILGSCYGTIGPTSTNPQTGLKYNLKFPLITIRDMAKAHALLQKHLGIQRIKLCIGGSMGGQQVMEWAISDPYLFESIALLSCNPYHSPWGIAFNEAQRMAIEAGIDKDGNVNPLGLEAARGLAMLSYRNYITFDLAQTETEEKIDNFRVSSYQRYQGIKLSKRFDAYSYITLSKAMDSHHVGRGRGGVPHALSLIKAKTAVIGINTDVLFPLSEQKVLADYIPGASLDKIHSDYGHDGFLLEYESIQEVLNKRLGL
ncbi:MAG: homoserine O-acetyltransferase [Saprospiraceae bacterium]